MSLSMNGGLQVPAGGADLGLWCRAQDGLGTVDDAQVMITHVGGFF
ncbi:MAG: hypothetical protein QM733_15315 [Ilumatobacteraceae bacterium]